MGGSIYPQPQVSGDMFQYILLGQTGTHVSLLFVAWEKQVCYTPRPTLCFLASEIGRTLNTVQKRKLLQASS